MSNINSKKQTKAIQKIRVSFKIKNLYFGHAKNRIYQHRYEKGSKFTTKYHVKDLLYFKFYDSIEEAIHNEKLLKKWNRSWKLELIEKNNPEFKDLAID